MRKNEYTSIEQFTNQYIGIWGPSDGDWYGLDFRWHGQEYRFQTGSMYNSENTILPDGREAIFGLYVKEKGGKYRILGEYATMSDVLESTVLEGIPFRKVIEDEDTELMGQD